MAAGNAGLAELPLSYNGLRIKILLTGAGVILACAIFTLLFNFVLGFGTRLEQIIIQLLWSVLVGLWSFGALLAWAWRNKTKYFYGPKGLIIKKARLFDSDKQLYLYRSIMDIQVKQSILGKKYNFGNIVFRLPVRAQPVILARIESPQEHALHLKELAHLTYKPSAAVKHK